MPPRREPTERAFEALAEAGALCEQLGQRDGWVAQRDALWAEAFDEGASYEMIAAECGVSKKLVQLRLAKFRGRAWADKA